jgi:hypothetical protein
MYSAQIVFDYIAFARMIKIVSENRRPGSTGIVKPQLLTCDSAARARRLSAFAFATNIKVLNDANVGDAVEVSEENIERGTRPQKSYP